MDTRSDRRQPEHLATMVSLEESIERRTDELLAEDISHERAVSLIEGLRGSSRERRLALVARLGSIAPEVAIRPAQPSPSVLDELYDREGYRASGALIALHGLLSQAFLGYALLLELSFRSADSVEHLGAENTGDLAWEHLRACAAHIRDLLRAMPYVVSDELELEGQDCRCTCPTCGLGVCGCVLAFRRRLDLALAEAGPIEEWPGIRLVRPRAGSPAALAGLRKDDIVEAIDGAVIDSIPQLQETIKAHPPGDRISMRVTRYDSGAEEVLVVERS